MTGRAVKWRGEDEGQLMVLLLGYALILIALITVVVSATAVHLQRNRLIALADAAALDAADALEASEFYRAGAADPADARSVVPLSDAGVRDSAKRYLRDTAATEGVTGVVVGAPTGSPDGRTAEVTLEATARLPLLSVVIAAWSDGVPLRATARARAAALP